MSYATLRINGREYVLVPKPEFQRLSAQDREDSAKARRPLAKLRAGKLKTISHEAVKHRLGLSANISGRSR